MAQMRKDFILSILFIFFKTISYRNLLLEIKIADISYVRRGIFYVLIVSRNVDKMRNLNAIRK